MKKKKKTSPSPIKEIHDSALDDTAKVIKLFNLSRDLSNALRMGDFPPFSEGQKEFRLSELKNVIDRNGNTNFTHKIYQSLKAKHNTLVKPFIQKDRKKIENIFAELPSFPGNQIDNLIFILKPIPLEQLIEHIKLFTSHFPGMISGSDIEKAVNDQIKHLSKAQGMFDKIILPYDDIITDRIKTRIIRLRKFLEGKKQVERMMRDIYGINENLDKEPQRFYYWNYTALPGLSLIKKYCSKTAEENNSKKKKCLSHPNESQAIRIIARLLKVLYPSIWGKSAEQKIFEKIRRRINAPIV